MRFYRGIAIKVHKPKPMMNSPSYTTLLDGMRLDVSTTSFKSETKYVSDRLDIP